MKAVDGVSFELRRGEVLGVVGESGIGKTTLGRTLLGCRPRPRARSCSRAATITGLGERGMRPLRRRMQIVFQDPHASLNPAMTIGDSVGDPLRIHGVTNDRHAIRRRVSPRLSSGSACARRAVHRQVPGRPLRRPEAARRAGPGDHPQPRPAGRRRAGVDARHERPGEDPRAHARAEGGARPHLPLHHARPGDGEVLLRPDRDHVPGQDRRDRAHRGDLRRTPGTRTRLAAEGDPRAGPDAGASLATCLGGDPRRRFAAARLPVPSALPAARSRSAAGRARPARPARGRWTGTGEDRFETERGTLGDLELLDEPATQVRVPAASGRSGADVAGMLDGVRADQPGEPFWTGVRSIDASGSGADVAFHDPVDPALRPVDDVHVACHLYDEALRPVRSPLAE